MIQFVDLAIERHRHLAARQIHNYWLFLRTLETSVVDRDF
jgi:hypothetical protein